MKNKLARKAVLLVWKFDREVLVIIKQASRHTSQEKKIPQWICTSLHGLILRIFFCSNDDKEGEERHHKGVCSSRLRLAQLQYSVRYADVDVKKQAFEFFSKAVELLWHQIGSTADILAWKIF
jgi:hypothetical protein